MRPPSQETAAPTRRSVRIDVARPTGRSATPAPQDALPSRDRSREATLDIIDRLVLWLGTPLMIGHVAFELSRRGTSVWFVLDTIFLALLLVNVLLTHRVVGTRGREVVHVVLLEAFAALILAQHGPYLESAALLAVAPAGAAIFLGRAGALGATAFTALILVIVGVTNDHGEPLERWLSGGFVITGVSLTLGILFATLQAWLYKSWDAARDALERERAERAAHEEAERELARGWRMEAVGRLAHGVAHEVNNALTVVLGNATVLRELAESEETRAMLDDTIAAGEAALATVKRMAALNEAGTERGVAEVADVVAAVVARLTPELPAGVTLDAEIRAKRSAAILRADLDRVLVAVLQNAWEAMPEGGAIDIEVDDGADREVVITVHDEGRGMSEATLERAVEPFFTTKPEGDGSGLGLTWAYAAIHHAGGALELESEEGAGTTVRITLPRRRPGWDQPVY